MEKGSLAPESRECVAGAVELARNFRRDTL
jgi:hypothetical protein